MKLNKFSAAKVIIPHPTDNKLLLVSREIEGQVGYEPAGGRMDVDFDTLSAESLEECAIREAKEELNLDINIQDYLGSYYFFWHNPIENSRFFTSCVVFLANALNDINNLSKIGDIELAPIYPEWIDINDIMNEKIYIRESCIGLKNIIKSTATKIKKQNELV